MIVRDIFGRVVNETGIVLVDWEGHIANPAMTYSVEVPGGSATLSSNEPRLYFDLPSSVGSNGPSKTLNSAGPSNAVEFRMSIFPDRDFALDKEHILTIRYTDGEGIIHTRTIDVYVIDQDVDRPLEFNVIADFSHDETGMFDNRAARATVQQGLDDFAYFIADMDLDEVRANEEKMWLPEPYDETTGRFVTNVNDYVGILVFVYGFPTVEYTASGWPTCGGQNLSSGGTEFPIKRSGGLTLTIEAVGIRWDGLRQRLKAIGGRRSFLADHMTYILV